MVVFFRKSGAGFREREVGARQACDTPFGAVPLRCERKAERDETGRGKTLQKLRVDVHPVSKVLVGRGRIFFPKRLKTKTSDCLPTRLPHQSPRKRNAGREKTHFHAPLDLHRDHFATHEPPPRRRTTRPYLNKVRAQWLLRSTAPPSASTSARRTHAWVCGSTTGTCVSLFLRRSDPERTRKWRRAAATGSARLLTRWTRKESTASRGRFE